MTSRELRERAIALAKELGHKRTWIQSASSQVLAEYLESGIVPNTESAAPVTLANEGEILDLLAQVLAARAKAQMDESAILDLVQDTIDESMRAMEEKMRALMSSIKPGVSQIEIVRPDGSTINVGRQHAYYPLLLKVYSAGLYPMLVGPAGSGKSHAAHAVAQAMNLEYYASSVCEMSTQTDLLGYRDAHGVYVPTLFREAYEKGGVFLLDEIDAGNPAVLLVLNQALANGACAFPDGMIKRHDDFILIASANTYGSGADRQYVGRNQLDAATLDRYFVIDWPYDQCLEADLVGSSASCAALDMQIDAGGILSATEWNEEIINYRERVNTLKMRHVVSPRATIGGVKCFAAGIGAKWVRAGLVYKGASMDTITRLNGGH